MYKLVTVEDVVRIPPKYFNQDLDDVIIAELNNTLAGRIHKEVGVILAATRVDDVSEGRIILGDGAVYYDTKFELLVYQPQLHEVVEGFATEAAEFGAFVCFGPIEGLIHVSQMTEDFMGYDEKNRMFVGKESKKSLKVGDEVRARIVTVSLKNRASASKIGLTMRQPYLGKIEWLIQEREERKKKADGVGKEPQKKKKTSKKKS